MAISVLKALGIVFSRAKYRVLFVIISVLMVIINILTLIGLQWILSGTPRINIGLFSKPPKIPIQTPIIMWVESNYGSSTLFWVIYFTPELFITIVLSSVLASLLFSEILYFSKEMRSKLKVRKKTWRLLSASITTVIGVTSMTSTTLSCPACGVTISATLIAILVSTITGSTLGVASIFIQFTFYLFWIGILLNLIMLYIISNNILKTAPIFEVPGRKLDKIK
ncbi:MAG: hypothetical protein QW128_05215 [Thermoprotei archaeon]